MIDLIDRMPPAKRPGAFFRRRDFRMGDQTNGGVRRRFRIDRRSLNLSKTAGHCMAQAAQIKHPIHAFGKVIIRHQLAQNDLRH